jgi:hypothetical protein
MNFQRCDTDGEEASATWVNQIRITGTSGVVQITDLAGTGTRSVYSDANGNLTNTSSDGRLKTRLEPLVYGIEEVTLLNPVSFFWKDPEKRGAQKEIGLIAQEVEKVVPEVCGVNSDRNAFT